MIKRIGALLLTLLYAITAFGFVLNMHYCGHLLTSVQINSPSKSCVKAERKMKCCNDKQLEVKIKDAHKNVVASSFPKLFAVDLPAVLFGDQLFSAQQVVAEKFLGRAPPDFLYSSVPAFIKNCTFRI